MGMILHSSFYNYLNNYSTMPIDTFLAQAASVVPSSTSSHLLTVHSQLLHEASKSLNVKQKRDYCGACGSVRKPEWTKVTEIKAKKSKPVATSTSQGATVYKCLRCRRRTVLPPKHIPAKPSRASVATSSAPTKGPSDPKSGDNQNSKKRAKARKQGGLQALLASKQQAQPSLDLLDFLQ
jgi:hypothetical protein